jgi:hypothetical protein
MKLRFLVASLKISPFETWEAAFAPGFNPDARDDGWWVDQIEVSESLASPALLEIDVKDLAHCAGDDSVGCFETSDCITQGTAGPCLGEAPQCGDTCTTLIANVQTDPDDTGGALDELLSAPGQPISLDASGSSGTCLNGSLQYKFSKGGVILRGFSENPVILDAPQVDTDYLVEIRCSTDGPDFNCSDPGNSPLAARIVDVNVDCPTSDTPLLGSFETILAADKTTFSWTTASSFQLRQGALADVSFYGGASSTGAGNSFAAAAVPGSGSGIYYVVRELGQFCNEVGSWSATECTLSAAAASWYPAPTCDRDVDIP